MIALLASCASQPGVDNTNTAKRIDNANTASGASDSSPPTPTSTTEAPEPAPFAANCYRPYVDIGRRFTHAFRDGREVIDQVEGYGKGDNGVVETLFTLAYVGYDERRRAYRYACHRPDSKGVQPEEVLFPEYTFQNSYPDNIYYPPLLYARRESQTLKYENVSVGSGVTREATKLESLFVWDGYFVKGKSYSQSKTFSYDQYHVESGFIETFPERGGEFNPRGLPTIFTFRTIWHGEGEHQRMVRLEYLSSDKPPNRK